MERQPKESANDRNDRAIRTAALWYSKHLKGKVDIVLLTDDADNRRKSVEKGIITYSVREYVKSLTDSPYLQDKLSSKDYETENSSKPLYPPHLTLVHVHDGIKNGKLLQGSFLANRENFLEGSVNTEKFEKAVR